MNGQKLVALDGIFFNMQEKTILNDITLSLRRQQIVTIIGPNGAGKSTLVKILLGLVKPTKGRVWRRQHLTVGYVPQRISLDKTLPMKVGRFLNLAQTSKQARDRALGQLSLAHLLNQQMAKLSGGELQRVLLARAIARQPDLLVLDEPLQGVDIAGQVKLYRLISSLRDSLNCAILMISHDLHLVMAQTDSVICLNHHICCHGQPESVSQHPEYLRLFGQQTLQDIAVYQHHHDHHHDLRGEAVDCNEDCDHA